MGNYKYLLLPVDLPIVDGCTLIDPAGNDFTYDPINHHDLNLSNFRRAEPFIVEDEFNQQKVVGVPSPAINWLKNGDEIPRGSVELYKGLVNPIIKIHCPSCKKLH